MKTQIIYSTESGTTRYVAELLKKALLEKKFEVDLFEVGDHQGPPDLNGYELILLGSPTYYGGQLETKMAELLSTYEVDLSSYKVAVFSLGDSNYRHFCASAEILEQWVTYNKGNVLTTSLKVDGYPEVEQVMAWANQVVEAVKA